LLTEKRAEIEPPILVGLCCPVVVFDLFLCAKSRDYLLHDNKKGVNCATVLLAGKYFINKLLSI